MARIPMSSGFTMIPEGTYVFKVKESDYDEEFSKLKMTFETQDGQTLREQFMFVKNDGTPNTGALNAFSFLAKTIMQDNDMADVDPADLVGRYLRAVVTHTESNGRTYAHLGDKSPADGWDNEGGDDLDALLD